MDTTSELAGLLHIVPLMLNVKQGSCEYQLLIRLYEGIEPSPTDYKADAPSTCMLHGFFL